MYHTAMSPRAPSRERPLVIYDGDCSFCAKCVLRWKRLTGPQVDYAPFQEVKDQFPGISREEFSASLQFIEPNGKIICGAEAVFRLLGYVPGLRWMPWIYEKVPGAAFIADRCYRFVAKHRGRL